MLWLVAHKLTLRACGTWDLQEPTNGTQKSQFLPGTGTRRASRPQFARRLYASTLYAERPLREDSDREMSAAGRWFFNAMQVRKRNQSCPARPCE